MAYKDIEKQKIQQKKYRQTTKGKEILVKRRVSLLRIKLLEKMGGKCVRCGFDDYRALQIDHVNGGGKKEIQSFNGSYRSYYKNVLKDSDTGRYQLLCANCNWIKRYENKECKNDII